MAWTRIGPACAGLPGAYHVPAAGSKGGLGMRLLVAGVFFLTSCFAALAEDGSGSADHPLIPRYEGSEIVRYDVQEFTEYRLPVGEAKAYGGLEKNLESTIALEGKVTRLSYRAPAERGVLEVFRNYENALKEAGFEQVFACSAASCGGRNFNHVIASGPLYGLFGEYYQEQRYLAAKSDKGPAPVYVSLYAVMNKAGGGPNRNRTMIQLDVIELKPMEERMVVVDAGMMGNELATEGSVALYGILFDFDKADIRPDSKPQLDEIAALLKSNPDLDVLVVGHTDGKGEFDYNQALSERRARAVVAALVDDYGISAKRLTPVGVGMAAPVATNRTEEGRAKNRRVVLVER